MADDGVIFDKASALRIQESVRAYERGEFPSDEPGKPSHSGWFEAEVVSATVLVADARWEYTLRMMTPGGTASDGLMPAPEFTFKGRNRWERTGLTKAGYVASVSKLLPIPVGAPVLGRWGSVSDGTRIFRFSERNEPVCT